MDEKKMSEFLTVSVIPKHKDKDRIYDCVFRAHRDVLTGRFHLPFYILQNRALINKLCDLIRKNDGQTKSSKRFIKCLKTKYENVEFGAIQKLVNMSLKYLLVLNKYEGHIIDIDEKYCDCPLDSTILDCLAEDVKDLPNSFAKECGIKEKTLIAIRENDIHWTSIENEQYNDVQKIIGFLTKDKGSKLAYDFDNWKKEKK